MLWAKGEVFVCCVQEVKCLSIVVLCCLRCQGEEICSLLCAEGEACCLGHIGGEICCLQGVGDEDEICVVWVVLKMCSLGCVCYEICGAEGELETCCLGCKG